MGREAKARVSSRPPAMHRRSSAPCTALAQYVSAWTGQENVSGMHCRAAGAVSRSVTVRCGGEPFTGSDAEWGSGSVDAFYEFTCIDLQSLL